MADARRSGMDAVSLAALRETLGEMADAIDAVNLGDGGRPCLVGYDGVWPDNMPVVEAFLAVATQWRTAVRGGGGAASPFGGSIAPLLTLFIGLDYASALASLDALGIAVTPDLWRDLQTMEFAALCRLNE
jgi:Phage related hypothetical protein (DUF1799)